MSRLPSRLHLIPHTHWDREWYLPFEVFRHRLVGVLDEVLDALERDPEARFTMDGQTAAVEDYLEVRPENAARLKRLVLAGRLAIGPFYVLADEFLCPAEAHAMNLELGLRACRPLGGACRVGYLPDLFGHVGQMPQLLDRAGIDVAVFWRGVDPEAGAQHVWVAPDGSEVLACFLEGGYGPIQALADTVEGFQDQMERALEALGPYRGPGPDVLLVGADHRPLEVDLLERVRTLRGRVETELCVSTWSEYLDELRAEVDLERLPRLHGEQRSSRRSPVLPGTLSSRHRVKQAQARATSALVDRAEPLVALALRVRGALDPGPPGGRRGPRPPELRLLERCWRLLLVNLAHDSICGCSADEVHDEGVIRARKAEQLAGSLAEAALAELVTSLGGGSSPVALVLRAAPGEAPLLPVELEVPPGAAPPALEDRQGSLPTLLAETLHEGRREVRSLPDRAALEEAIAQLRWGQWGEWLIERFEPSPEGQDRRLRAVLTRRGTPHPDLAPLYEWLAGQPARGEWELELVEPDELRLLTRPRTSARLGVEPLRRGGVADAPEGWELLRVGERASLGEASVSVDPRDGTLRWEDGVRGVDLVGLGRVVDVGDRGDLYTHEPVGQGVAHPVELEPVEWRRLGEEAVELQVVRRVLLPEGLDRGRRARSPNRRPSELAMSARLDRSGWLSLDLRLVNRARDHLLALAFPTGVDVPELVAGQPFGQAVRPLAPPAARTGDAEVPGRSQPFQEWVGAWNRDAGLVVMADDLHEVAGRTARLAAGRQTVLELTLLRSTGWLSRADLVARPGHAGPPLATPGAQEPGEHRYRIHLAPWSARRGPPGPLARVLLGGVSLLPAPSASWPTLGGRGAAKTASWPGLEVSGEGVVVRALRPDPDGRGVLLRLFEASGRPGEVHLQWEDRRARLELIDLQGQRSRTRSSRKGPVTLSLAPWEILTVRVR